MEILRTLMMMLPNPSEGFRLIRSAVKVMSNSGFPLRRYGLMRKPGYQRHISENAPTSDFAEGLAMVFPRNRWSACYNTSLGSKFDVRV